MIIGKNNFKNNTNTNFNSNFKERFQTVNKESQNIKISENTQQSIHADITNKNDMADKSFQMLQERYSKGLISVEEFNKKCQQLNKFRKR